MYESNYVSLLGIRMGLNVDRKYLDGHITACGLLENVTLRKHRMDYAGADRIEEQLVVAKRVMVVA
jgi:hypothetical protein